MKFFLLFNLFVLSLYAQALDSNSSVVVSNENDINSTQEESVRPSTDIMIIKDESGLSADAVRKRAKEGDNKAVTKVSVEDVVKSMDASGHVNISHIQDRWEDLSPTPVKYDWVRTKSGEWFKGEIKALYNSELEFDSDEIGLYTFDFDDVTEIKTYNIMNVNIENVASFPGIIRLKDKKIKIIQGENSYEFTKKEIISFAPDGKYERNFWSGKLAFSLDFRRGNNNQYDYSGKINLMRRSSVSRLALDYLGRITSQDDEETANNHRFNQKYDRYIDRNLFWTPVFSEIYKDPYRNIDRQLTLGTGFGYTILDTKTTTWNLSGGPAFLYTRYGTVVDNKDISDISPSLELSTKYEVELNKITDIVYDYKLTYTNKNAGTYKHHMLVTFENELTSWLDLDITGVWDYILDPEKLEDGTIPEKSDFQMLVGLGVEF